MTVIALREAATRIAGPDAVHVTDDGSISVDGVSPRIVVAPDTAEGVAATLAWANSERLSVLIGGYGTKEQWGRRPSRIDVGLSLVRLNRVIEHRSSDLTATVEAGAILDDVNAVLGRERQFLAIDPPYSNQATIGGILATNDSGPLRHRYGTPRDQIIGITIATVEGQLAHAGGHVVKNVAGYDLSKLMCGSHGALAAIVSATFKLTPRPASTATVVVSDASADTMWKTAVAVNTRQLEPIAMDVTADVGPDGQRTSMLIRFGSVPASVDASVIEMREVLAALGQTASAVAGLEEAELWQAHAARPLHGTPAVVRASWLPADLAPWLSALTELSAIASLSFTGRLAVGAGLVSISGDVAAQIEVIRHLRSLTHVGHVVIVRGTRELRDQIDSWDQPPTFARLWAPLKHAWDPNAILGAARGPL